jgi:hypothetical protein
MSLKKYINESPKIITYVFGTIKRKANVEGAKTQTCARR